MKVRHVMFSASIVAVAAVVLLSTLNSVQACGPDFEPDVFVRIDSPDNLRAFGAGHLGILQAHYDSNEYAVAYRYLNGGRLSSAELDSYAPAPQPPHILRDETKFTPAQIEAAEAEDRKDRTDSSAPGQWLLERAKYVPAVAAAPPTPTFLTDYFGNIVFDPSYLNCPDAAFQNAILTLKQRVSAWGKQSPWLVDWIHGQDAVFSNCAGKSLTTPAPVLAGSPALLRVDRTYQVAAATFYAKQFDQAAQQFEAIARDKSSPWSAWGQYLAARAMVRKAFAMGKATDPFSGNLASFDLDTMRQAQQILEALLAESAPQPSRDIVRHELNFIRIRTEPDKRAAEICAALTGPAPDPDFTQDLDDLNFILTEPAILKAVKQNPPPLLDWIFSWRNGTNSAFETWKTTHSSAWFVLAMAKAAPSDPEVPQMLAEAETIRPGSPAYDTVFYHRVRLLIGLNRRDEARALLDAAIPELRRQPPSSNLNALLGERMAVARTFNEFLKYAPRTILESSSAGADTLLGTCGANCPSPQNPPGFDEDSVNILNRQTPLDLLVDAAVSPTLPTNLRHDLVLAAWTRSVVLEDAVSAAKLSPLLPKSIRNTASSSVGFKADLAILRNPGLRPYLEPGISRLASFDSFDDLRNNWWSSNWNDSEQVTAQTVSQIDPSAFLTKEQRSTADAQYQRVMEQPDAPVVIGKRVIDYAKKPPDDPEVPEALALTVRATHYSTADWGNDSRTRAAENTAVSKTAFQLLHIRYPKSSWTAKTPYYY